MLALLGLDLTLVVFGASAVPSRALWHVVGFSLVYSGCWYGLSRLTSARTALACLAILSALCVPVAFRKDGSKPQSHVNFGGESHRLWSSTLGDPRQRVARVQPVTPGDDSYQLRVRLDRHYRGPARLSAAVNGVPLGTLTWPSDEDGENVEAAAPVPPFALSCGPIGMRPLESWPRCDGQSAMSNATAGGQRLALIEIWQDRPDWQLRVVTQRAYGGAALEADNSWFFDGDQWRRGVVDSGGTTIAPGLWHAFLAHGEVGR